MPNPQMCGVAAVSGPKRHSQLRMPTGNVYWRAWADFVVVRCQDFGDKVNRVRCKPVLHSEATTESLNHAIRMARLKTARMIPRPSLV